MAEGDASDRGGIPGDGLPPEAVVAEERERWDEGKTVRERIYETVLGLREPTTVSEVAERAACSVESARNHLGWFAEIGIVERAGEGRPARFRRNEAYFRWKRADDLRREHTAAELDARLEIFLERDRAYQDQYGTSDPAGVNVFDHADPGDHEALEAVHRDVNDWLTVREEARTVEEARRLQREGSPATA